MKKKTNIKVIKNNLYGTTKNDGFVITNEDIKKSLKIVEESSFIISVNKE